VVGIDKVLLGGGHDLVRWHVIKYEHRVVLVREGVSVVTHPDHRVAQVDKLVGPHLHRLEQEGARGVEARRQSGLREPHPQRLIGECESERLVTSAGGVALGDGESEVRLAAVAQACDGSLQQEGAKAAMVGMSPHIGHPRAAVGRSSVALVDEQAGDHLVTVHHERRLRHQWPEDFAPNDQHHQPDVQPDVGVVVGVARRIGLALRGHQAHDVEGRGVHSDEVEAIGQRGLMPVGASEVGVDGERVSVSHGHRPALEQRAAERWVGCQLPARKAVEHEVDDLSLVEVRLEEVSQRCAITSVAEVAHPGNPLASEQDFARLVRDVVVGHDVTVVAGRSCRAEGGRRCGRFVDETPAEWTGHRRVNVQKDSCVCP
jgi:hypothetical protein